VRAQPWRFASLSGHKKEISAGNRRERRIKMKLVKLTMLAATAAVAASAFIGASSASAVTHPWIQLCDIQTLLLCPTEHLIKHPLLGRFLLLTGPGAFEAGFVTVKCASGMGDTNEVESAQIQSPETTATVPGEKVGESAFLSKLETLTFKECSGCTGVAVEPTLTHLWMEGPETAEKNTWWLTALNAKVKFTGCPLSQTCIYEGTLKFKVQMDEEGAFADPEGQEFKRGAGSTSLCAEKGKWASGRTRVDWRLDDKIVQNDGTLGSIHRHIWPTLLAELTKHEGTTLPKE
jgi:hypothetical protein